MKKPLVFVLLTALLCLLFAGCTHQTELNSSAPGPAPAPIVLSANPISVIIDYCDDNDNVNDWGGFWYTYDDTKAPNFGSSEVVPRNGASFTMSYVAAGWPESAGSNMYAARMSGYVKLDYSYPFIGMGTSLSPEEEPKDFTSFSGIRFWAKRGAGDQVITYRMALKSSNNPNTSLYDYYGYVFTPGEGSWAQVVVRFESPQFTTTFGSALDKVESLAHVQAIQFQTKGAVPPAGAPQYADLWVDNIELFRD